MNAKFLLQFVALFVVAFAAFASIILAGFLIAPVASLIVFGIEFIAFIKGMDYIYKKKRNKKQED